MRSFLCNSMVVYGNVYSTRILVFVIVRFR